MYIHHMNQLINLKTFNNPEVNKLIFFFIYHDFILNTVKHLGHI